MNKKILLLSTLTGLALATSAQAQIVNAYWSFNDYANGDTVAADGQPVVTAETFTGTPTLSATGSAAIYSSFVTAAFTAFDSVNYVGGEALTWNPNSTGNSFTLGLDMTNTENLTMDFQYRGTASVGFTAFSAIDYSLDGGSNYFTAVTSPTLTMNSTLNTVSGLDFSAVSAIEDQSSVLIRFSLGDVPASNSFRIENLQLTATIPEPGTLALVGLSLGALLLFRRRR